MIASLTPAALAAALYSTTHPYASNLAAGLFGAALASALYHMVPPLRILRTYPIFPTPRRGSAPARAIAASAGHFATNLILIVAILGAAYALYLLDTTLWLSSAIMVLLGASLCLAVLCQDLPSEFGGRNPEPGGSNGTDR